MARRSARKSRRAGPEAPAPERGGRAPQPAPPRVRIARAALPLAVAAALLVIYWLTLAPSIAEKDSGEVAAAVHVMGVPHPTGYPLYLIAGKLFDLAPVGEPAQRIAFLSAVSVAAAGGLVCWMLIALTGSMVAGAAGGLALGLNWWVWPQANQVEVYGFNLLLIALALAMFTRWAAAPGLRRLNLLAFFSGLTLTHHRTALLVVAPAVAWAAVATVRGRSWRILWRTALFAALPLLLYLWLPLRSAFNPPVNWGNTSGSLANFYQHISGGLYYRLAFGASGADAAAETGIALAGLWRQLSVIGIAFMLVGVVAALRRREWRPLGACLGAGFVAIGIWAGYYDVGDRHVFYAPALVAVAMWCGVGVSVALERARDIRLSAALRRFAPAAMVLAALAFPARMAWTNWGIVDRSDQYEPLEAARLNTNGVAREGVLLLAGDEANAYTYYYYMVLHPQRQPTQLCTTLSRQQWCRPLLAPEVRRIVEEISGHSETVQMAALVYRMREITDPERPVYTNLQMASAPAGYVVVRDYTLNRLVRDPGLDEAPDGPDFEPILDLPYGAGSLVDVSLPATARRGEVFTFTAAIRWAGEAAPPADLHFIFAREGSDPGGPRPDLRGFDRRRIIPRGPVLFGLYIDYYDPYAAHSRARMVRPTPVLLGVNMPANREGHHYRQPVTALFGRRLEAGRYLAFVRLVVNDEPRSDLIPVGSLMVR